MSIVWKPSASTDGLEVMTGPERPRFFIEAEKTEIAELTRWIEEQGR